MMVLMSAENARHEQWRQRAAERASAIALERSTRYLAVQRAREERAAARAARIATRSSVGTGFTGASLSRPGTSPVLPTASIRADVDGTGEAMLDASVAPEAQIEALRRHPAVTAELCATAAQPPPPRASA